MHPGSDLPPASPSSTPQDLEYHPWPPFIPPHAEVLFMGTFPPPRTRWSMDFFYPNRTNDFWHMMGLIWRQDRTALYDPATRQFRLPEIKALMAECRSALSDTGHAVRRLKSNASDKFLEIVEPVDLQALLSAMPSCRAIVTTGEKATEVAARLLGVVPPAMGECVTATQLPFSLPHPIPAEGITLWRMPSTSRAYPLPLEKKADYYRRVYHSLGML